MDRTRLALAGMWIAAIAVMVGIYVTQEPPADPRVRRGQTATVLGPDDVAVGAAPTTPPRPPEPGPARQFQGDRRHTGRSSFAGPSAVGSSSSVETGGPITAQAVVGDDGTAYVGSHDHFLYAIAPDGSTRWRADLGGPVYATAALVGDRLFVGSDNDFFFCVDRADGRVIWALPTEDDADTGVAVAPDGTLVFGSGPDVFAVRPDDGSVLWRFRTGLAVFTTPAIDDDGTIYAGSQDDHLYALAPDGRMRWRYHAGDDVDGSPVIGDDGTIYVGSDDDRVHAVARDGTLRWSADVGADVRAPVGLGLDGSIYVSVFSPSPRLLALDARDGSEKWAFPITSGDSRVNVRSGALVDRDGNVYFGADDEFVYSLEPSGRMRWFTQTHGDVVAPPVLRPDGSLVVGSMDHAIWTITPPPS